MAVGHGTACLPGSPAACSLHGLATWRTGGDKVRWRESLGGKEGRQGHSQLKDFVFRPKTMSIRFLGLLRLDSLILILINYVIQRSYKSI